MMLREALEAKIAEWEASIEKVHRDGYSAGLGARLAEEAMERAMQECIKELRVLLGEPA